MFTWLRKLLFGPPLPTWRAIHERLPKALALPVFASDAISSVAYATEEILLALVIAGTAVVTQTDVSMGIAITIAVLLAIVVTSYRQTIFSYPSGGGAYSVAKDNLGIYPGLVAGASLIVGYVLTVAVSVAAGVAAVLSFAPSLEVYRVGLGVIVVTLIALANLRGLRESGLLFSIPTYTFLAAAFVLVAVGIYKVSQSGFVVAPPPATTIPIATQGLTWFLILRAFAGGCSAMTGTEAITNGVQAFRPPESKNAATTLVMMAMLLGSLYLGMTYIASKAQVIPMSQTAAAYQTVLSQIASAIFGKTWFYYLFQGATAAILMLAANTSYAGFPRLGSIMARDRFLPRQLYNVGDRLVFSNGIVLLSLLAILLIIAFNGVVNRLIPLYAIGVFMSFTLSQAGMVIHFRRLKEPGWRRHAVISGIGAIATLVVAIVMAVTKAAEGAWIVLVLIPLLVYLFAKVHKHYIVLGQQLRLYPEDKFTTLNNTVLVLVPSIHKGVLPALEYARTLSSDVRAVHVETDPEPTPLLEERWDMWSGGIPLIILESPYRSLLGPLLEYIDEAKGERPDYVLTVIVPEFVPAKWWQKVLHNQSGFILKFALLFKPGVITANVRYYLEK